MASLGRLLMVLCMVWTSHAFALPSGPTRTPTSRAATLGFLSFDLDDTLFPIGPVVEESNQAMFSYMQEKYGCRDVTAESFRETTREIRQGLSQAVTYTELRTRAIQAELEKASGGPVDSLSAVDCFERWLEERHAAAERYLFQDAVETLQSLRATHPDVCVAAITNGRGNPLEMKSTLAHFFDFCVSGEDEEVFPNRKPHSGIYETALARYREHKPHHDEEYLWCHVGDCLANDVGASAACGASAIWMCPDDEAVDAAISRLTGNQPSWSTASSADIQQRASLAQAAKSKIATRIRSLSELTTAVTVLLESQEEVVAGDRC